MDCTQIFDDHRHLLFAIAYRMLGLVHDAEDMVQESFIRWTKACPGEIQLPKAYLTTLITRLCIDYLRSAQVQRETYIGPWLPAPLLTTPDPAHTIENRETLSLAFLLMLERLNPVERAVFLLREVFEFSYSEIAACVDKSEANCRQMMTRARQHMKADTPLTLNSEVQQAVVSRFLTLMAEGDWPALLALLTEDAVAISDGGGKVFAARKPITGHEAIVHFLRRLKELAPPTTHLEPISVNGQWGWQIHVDGQLMAVMIPQISTQGKIIGLYNILNPDKLSHLVRAD